MENENKQSVQTEEQQKEPQGWKDVQITPDMPLSALIGFFNVLNQRLCAVENLVPVQVEGKTISLTEFYAQQEAEQRKQMEEEAKKQAEDKKGE